VDRGRYLACSDKKAIDRPKISTDLLAALPMIVLVLPEIPLMDQISIVTGAKWYWSSELQGRVSLLDQVAGVLASRGARGHFVPNRPLSSKVDSELHSRILREHRQARNSHA
jgi:hypothetical protein